MVHIKKIFKKKHSEKKIFILLKDLIIWLISIRWEILLD